VIAASERGRAFIASWEGGHRLSAYKCPAGVWTIGAGLTSYPDGRRVKRSDRLTLAEAERLFVVRLARFEADVDSMTRDDVTQEEFDALTSFCWNVGPSALLNSTLLACVNSRDTDRAIRSQFLRWVYAGGKRLRGLERRRLAEAGIYTEGVYIGADGELIA
jgi:lysozyme